MRMSNFLWWEHCPRKVRSALIMTKNLDRGQWEKWRKKGGTPDADWNAAL